MFVVSAVWQLGWGEVRSTIRSYVGRETFGLLLSGELATKTPLGLRSYRARFVRSARRFEKSRSGTPASETGRPNPFIHFSTSINLHTPRRKGGGAAARFATLCSHGHNIACTPHGFYNCAGRETHIIHVHRTGVHRSARQACLFGPGLQRPERNLVYSIGHEQAGNDEKNAPSKRKLRFQNENQTERAKAYQSRKVLRRWTSLQNNPTDLSWTTCYFI